MLSVYAVRKTRVPFIQWVQRGISMDDFASYSQKPRQTDWTKEAETIAASYNGKNENELTRDIFARAAEGKKNGTLTNEQIDLFYSQFAPMLDGPKRKKLKKLVEQLKNM